MAAAESEFLALAPDRTVDVTRSWVGRFPGYITCLRQYRYSPCLLAFSFFLLTSRRLKHSIKHSQSLRSLPRYKNHLQFDPSCVQGERATLERQLTHPALTLWRKRKPTRAHQSQSLFPSTQARTMIHGRSHSQLLSMHIRVISYFDISLFRQRFTSGGQYFCLKDTLVHDFN